MLEAAKSTSDVEAEFRKAPSVPVSRMTAGPARRLAVFLLLALALHAAIFWLVGPQERFEERTIAVQVGSGEAPGQVPPLQHVPAPAEQPDGQGQAPRPAGNAQVMHSRIPTAGMVNQSPPTRGLEAGVPDSGPSEAKRLAREDYRQVLAGWLRKHREYPLHLRRLGVTGEGVLRLEVERTGALVLARMEQGTGDRRLDDLTLALAKRANPFPAMPEALAGSTFDCLIDVRYELPP
jgi:TonB family protein